MRCPNKFASLLAATLGLYTHLVLASSAPLVQGEARKPGSDTLLYTEKYFYEGADQWLVIYYEPNGSEFARKTLDYSRAESAPFFKQQNTRVGEFMQVSPGNNGNINILYKSSTEAITEESEIEAKENLVIDAGFDHFIKRNWQDLTADKELVFDYLLPTRGTTVELAIKKFICSPDLLCLKIYPANPFLGFFAGDIKLEYRDDSKQLLHFKGKSNIANSEGKYQNVNISYQYFSSTSKPNEREPSL